MGQPTLRQTVGPPTDCRCVVCGAPLSGRYWITAHPHGVHQECRAWEAEPFPFEDDITRLRRVARAVQRVWRQIVRDGRWLASVRRDWPGKARRLASEWLERKDRLEHHLSQLRERLRM